MHSGFNINIIAFLLGCLVVLSTGCPASAQIGVGDQFSLPVVFEMDPTYAQFMSPTRCVKGDKDGLALVNLESGEEIQRVLENDSISVLMRNPHRFGEVLAGTWSGKLFRVRLDGDILDIDEIKGLWESPVRVVHSIVFHSEDPEQVIVADYNKLCICKLDGLKLQCMKTRSPDDSEALITMIVPDIRSKDWFMVAATGEKRYRGNWDTGKLDNISGKILEYGYNLKKSGVSFLPRGDFDQYLYIDFIPARPTSIIQHPSNPMIYYASAIGTSPLKITVDSRNFYNLDFIAPNRMLTFSIDVDPTNESHLLITTYKSVQVSTDAGKTWKTYS